MNRIALLAGVLLMAAGVAAQPATTPATTKPAGQAAAVVEAYLAMPYAATWDEGYAKRVETLGKLKGLDDAVGAIGDGIARAKQPGQRVELVAALRGFQGPSSAEICIHMLKDSDAKVRNAALHELRMLARKADIAGPERTVRSDNLKPIVPGLLPHLIAAADDKDANNRDLALYALADTREPEAAGVLRKKLADPSDKVRLHAACLLTEFKDDSGMKELRKGLLRIRADKGELRYSEAGCVLASLERITGKSFGRLPMDPSLSSDSRAAEQATKEYDKLLGAWADWFAAQPL